MNVANTFGKTSQTLMDKVTAQYETFVQKFNLDEVNWKEIGSYMVIGFVAGFIARRYLRPLIITAIIVLVALKGLEYYHLVEINWEQIRQLAGIHSVDGMQGILDTTIALVRNNLTVAISSIIGFVIGYKIG